MNEPAARLSPETSAESTIARPGFGEAFRFWLKLGFISFGGPAGQIAIMHRELVERRRWISEPRFLHALNFCMLLPGPEAQQLAVYIGWLLHRVRGGLVAGLLFILPSIVILWLLSYVYVVYGRLPAVIAIFYGLKPAVIAIVAAAALRIGSRTLNRASSWAIALVAFAAITAGAPFPLIILGAALTGLLFLRRSSPDTRPDSAGLGAAPSWGRSIRVAGLGLALWWLPILSAGALHGWENSLFREGVFFAKAAVVTFGGAYAVLPYVAQQAVEQHGWLNASQMMDGLALAETTPGPLIMVLQFVGFLGGWNQPGSLSPLVAATLGALLTTWATFAPCFLWIFLGAPYIERLRENARLTAALSAVTAAVVGVIANLALWFAWHVVVPSPGLVDWFALALSVAAFVALIRWKWDIVIVILASGAVGFVYHLLV